MPNGLSLAILVHDDTSYLKEVVKSFGGSWPVHIFVSRIPWHGTAGDWMGAVEAAKDCGASVVTGEWHSEEEHRKAAQEYLLEAGFTHALIPDADEIIEPRLLAALAAIAESELADRVYVEWDTYWKSAEYVIRPRERFTPLILIDLRAVKCVKNRHYEGGRGLFLSQEYGIIHHLSYVGPNSRIRRKIETWGHADEVVDRWATQVWLAWDADRTLRNLHPTHPDAYGIAQRMAIPEILQGAHARYLELGGATAPSPLVAEQLPKISVVIPLYGGEEDIRACLESIGENRDLFHEVVVVDNASPDNAMEIAKSFDFVHLIPHESNLGFAAACNRGWQFSTGEIVLFLNSDTIITRSGLIRLVQSLLVSGSVAAAGPLTNRSGHNQQISPIYDSPETLPLFADDFAQRNAEDIDCDMLVGFCMAVRRSVLDELGGFDERFGLGTFEDNDLCYRFRRAGYRLVISTRSFIHHSGSQTMTRMQLDTERLLASNLQAYRAKWREDLETGYASTLSGLTSERITFDLSRRPDARRKRMAEMAQRADISLCMIVKNEERVLAEALHSAKPFFSEIIVVDTGSDDGTVEIAESSGAKVFSFPWTNNFAEARNISLKQAKGRWIFWMDADDTLSWESGEALVEAALNAPREVAAFVVPVQFVDDGTTGGGNVSGTRVDHVKLFRNMPGLQFEGRIHEQILPSIRAHGGAVIARCSAVVLHSGYDTSVEGQARKRQRDMQILKLELRERRRHPFVLFNIGMTYHYTNEHKRAIRWLKRCVQYSPPTDSHVRKAYSLQGVSHRQLGDAEECIRVLNEGIAVVGDDPDLLFQLALTTASLGRTEEAITHYERVVGLDVSGYFTSIDTGILGFKTYHNLGALCLEQGDYLRAKEWWRKAIENQGGPSASSEELFHAAISRYDFRTAKEELDRISSWEGDSVRWTELLVKFTEATAGEGAVETVLRARMQSSRSLGATLVLARRLLNSGRTQESVGMLHELEGAGVAEAAYFLGVIAIQADRFAEALKWMQRAHFLNPNHAETKKSIEGLELALGAGTVDVEKS